MKYYEDGTWIGEVNCESNTVELVIEGTSNGADTDYQKLSQDVLNNFSKYKKAALERLSVWARHPENIQAIFQIYCGKLYCGFGTEPIEKGFCLSFDDKDFHTIHTVIFSEDKSPLAYVMHFE